ncbi:YafY family transcriptional regulator [Paenibacillus albidus]|uniref:helix-turn-helix transcriptional regulator n=1 Tax=Paenibacillus albidus TaxID=2041023 RepID=UPI001BE9B4AA|nr:YafY family protein [Paenibacillus albidus]MBT2290825.1 YafY family transcriptional regulator [Paenibacillus albidus]
MRADRLLSILLLLQNRGKMSSRELAQLLEVSERTVFRDMEALSASGIPVLAERGREGGWMLTEGYRTSLTGMKPQEIASLLLSADYSILSDLGIQKDYTAAVRKLEAVSSTDPGSVMSYLSQRIHVDGASWHPSDESYPFLSLLQEALWEDRKVSISYLRNGETVERLIEPLGLVAKRGVWYIVARSTEGLRTYRVSRMVRAEASRETFTRPEDFDLMRYWEESTRAFKSALPRYPARVLVKEEYLQAFTRERYVTVIATEPASKPGFVLAEAEFNTVESACRIVLSFGPQVRVISPQELIDSVTAAIHETFGLYQENNLEI